jgi:MerR family transcriptional regulator, light-induced transcriptional regulator
MAASAEGRRVAPEALRVRDDYLAALLAADLVGARRVIAAALDAGVSARDLYLDVVQPALYEVGLRWSRAEISVAQEHLATAATQSNLTWMSERLQEGERDARGRVLIACAEDELHVLGVRMVADFLEAEGWEATFVGAMTPPEGLAELAGSADVVAISAALPERIPLVARAVSALREAPGTPFIVVGGQAFAGSEQRALSTGADAWASDAQEAVRVLDARFPA